MTSSPWVSGTWASGYYGPVKGFGATLDGALDDLERKCREQTPHANWLVGLEAVVDFSTVQWSAVATAARLQPYPQDYAAEIGGNYA